MRSLLNNIHYIILYTTAYLISLLPMRLLYFCSGIAFHIVYYLVPYRRDVVIQNLSRSFPDMRYGDIKAVSKAFYRSFTNNFVEIIKSLSISTEKQQRKLILSNFEVVDEQLNKGKSVITCTGHGGNWEIFNIMPSMVKHVDSYAVYKPLRTAAVDKLFIKLRSRFGMKLVPSRMVARQFLSNKDKPSMYLFLADQCPKHADDKYETLFLHQKTHMFPGVEKLARSTNSAVVYIGVTEPSRGHYIAEFELICSDGAETQEMEITRRYAQLLEQTIEKAPASWLWTHKRWKR